MPRAAVTRPLPAALLRELEAAQHELQQGRFEVARQRYQRVLKREPDLAAALHFLGVLEHMDGNSAKGLSLVQRALQQEPDNYDIRKNLGNVLNDMNRCDEAEALCRELIAERPLDAGNHVNHGIVLRKLGRFAQAIASGRQAVKLDSDNSAAWLALANALRFAREFEQAVQAYERVIALKPAFAPAHQSLCRVLLRIEQSGLVSRFHLTRTKRACRRWVETMPDDATAAYMLSAIEQRQTPARMPDATVKASFDAYADDFDTHIRSLGYCAPEQIAQVLTQRLDSANTKLDILDGGCGTGLAAPLLRPWAKRLVGIDLSSAMLGRARATGCYDDLVEVELGAFLAQHPASFDVCVMVDVLVYFGDLKAILLAAARALRPGGLIAFSVEKSRRAGSHLHPSGRYSQHRAHVQAALAAAGLVAIKQVEAHIRCENRIPVVGLIVSAQRPP